MSEFIFRPGFNRTLLTNTPIQNKNDEWIQLLLNNYKYYDEKKEFDENTGDDVDLVISHKPIIPDLVIYNKTFNKNNCFLEGNTKERNNFPRKQFFIRFTEKDKEQLKKFNINRKNKEKEKKIENNYTTQDLKKDNNNYNNNNLNEKENENEVTQKDEKNKNEEINKNIDKNGEQIKEEKEKTEEIGDEKEIDSEEEEKNSEEKEEEDEENNNNDIESNEEEKNEEKKNVNINGIQNNDDGISNLSTVSKEFYEFYPKNYNKNINQKNNNMNNNNNNNNNLNNSLNNNNMNNNLNNKPNNNNMNNNMNNINPNFDFNQFNNLDNISLSEEISQKGDISLDSSLLNNVNNLMDTTNSQIGNESFINKNPNQFNLLGANNLNNFGFPNNNNMNNNDLKLKLLLMQQQNNNNQFNQLNQNNNIFNLLNGNQNYMNNLNMLNNNGNNGFSFNPLQNNYNLNLQDNILRLTLDCMDNKGWNIFSQDGNFINEFTSLELFQYLTEKIVGNIKLDNLYISNKNLKERITGGLMYMKLLEALPSAYQIMENQIMKEMELKCNILGATNNLSSNIGAGSIFSNNNLNFNLNNMNNNMNLNNNYIMNNLNNSNAFSK